jgi:hypothetical protein
VAVLATLVSLILTSGRVGPSLAPHVTPPSGATVLFDDSGTHVGLDARTVAYSLVGLLVGAWAAATMVALLLRYVHEGTASSFDFRAGLPHLPWVLVATLLIALLDAGLRLLLIVGLPGDTWELTTLLEFAMPLLLGTALLFYVPLIVDGADGLRALLKSLRLVSRSGFRRLLVYVFCADLVLMALALATNVFGMLLPSTARGPLDQLVLGLIVTPLIVSFTVVLYLICTGARAPLVTATPSVADRSRGSLA